MREYRRWTPREKQALEQMWPTRLTIVEMARRLRRHPKVVSRMADELRLPERVVQPEPKKQQDLWNPDKPFIATIPFLSGWLTVYGKLPVCAECKTRIYRTQGVIWQGKGLTHQACRRRVG